MAALRALCITYFYLETCRLDQHNDSVLLTNITLVADDSLTKNDNHEN